MLYFPPIWPSCTAIFGRYAKFRPVSGPDQCPSPTTRTGRRVRDLVFRGRGQLAVFPRCSLKPYDSDMGAFPPVRSDRPEKQPTDLTAADKLPLISGTGH